MINHQPGRLDPDIDMGETSVWTRVSVGKAGCSGMIQSGFSDLGGQGGGFTFWSTNGCSSLASAVAVPSSDALEIESPSDCLLRFPPSIRGVAYVSTT